MKLGVQVRAEARWRMFGRFDFPTLREGLLMIWCFDFHLRALGQSTLSFSVQRSLHHRPSERNLTCTLAVGLRTRNRRMLIWLSSSHACIVWCGGVREHGGNETRQAGVFTVSRQDGQF